MFIDNHRLSWIVQPEIKTFLLIGFLTTIIFFNPLYVWSEETVLHLFKAQNADPRLEDLLYLSAGVALSEKGLSSTRNTEKADYILLAEYATSESTVGIRYSVFLHSVSGRVLATEDVDLPIDYRFDEKIMRTITDVFMKATCSHPSRSRRPIRAARPSSERPAVVSRA
jgi:hypothetical protein